MQPIRYVIIGNGAAGVTAAETIRQQDPLGEITIISAEPYPMYSRPGLAYLLINEISQQHLRTFPIMIGLIVTPLAVHRHTGLPWLSGRVRGNFLL